MMIFTIHSTKIPPDLRLPPAPQLSATAARIAAPLAAPNGAISPRAWCSSHEGGEDNPKTRPMGIYLCFLCLMKSDTIDII